MDAPLSPRNPLEMLHRVGHVHKLSVDAGTIEQLIEEAAGRADEGPAEAILLVAGLLTDKHQVGAIRSLAAHRLGGARIQVAGSAVRRELTKFIQCCSVAFDHEFLILTLVPTSVRSRVTHLSLRGFDVVLLC